MQISLRDINKPMKETDNRKNKIRIILFAAAAVCAAALIIIGVCRGEPGVILQNAVNICLECIGLGR